MQRNRWFVVELNLSAPANVGRPALIVTAESFELAYARTAPLVHQQLRTALNLEVGTQLPHAWVPEVTASTVQIYRLRTPTDNVQALLVVTEALFVS